MGKGQGPGIEDLGSRTAACLDAVTRLTGGRYRRRGLGTGSGNETQERGAEARIGICRFTREELNH